MRLLAVGLLSALVTTTYSQQLASQCVTGNVCYSVNVPENSASSGDGDIFFQISGPSDFQYIALGQGTQMAGANIFIIYADESGTNVTLSPRLGKGNREPDADDSGQATLLSGSGIADGKMTANVRCSKCTSWTGGEMDLTSASSQWIWAVKSGSSVNSNSVSTHLSQHEGQGSFNLDLTKARGGNSVNPFVESQTTTTGATPSSVAESPSGSSSGSAGTSSGGSSGGAADYAQVAQNYAKRNKAVIAHGVVMGLSFALLFPLGAILIRLLSFSGLVWFHAGLQVLALALAIAGMGLGIYIATWPKEVHYINHHHPIIGLVVISLLVFQPILGLLHHQMYKRNGGIRTIWASLHVWYGRALITLGIINGGLGLRLSENTKGGEIAYGVVAGFMWLLWMAVSIASYVRSTKQPTSGETGEKLTGGYQRNRGSPYSSSQEEDGGRRQRK